MTRNYIKLPIIKKVEVKNYSLFRKDWKFEFKRGLNLFLGGNTLGKTTSVYIILYGISGIPKEKKGFFTKRIKNKNEDPLVKLVLKVNRSEIELIRSLKSSDIIFLSINGKKLSSKKDLNEKFEEEIKSLTKISSLEDFRFLFEKLLIREEEGAYLLWSPGDQAKVLRILFGYEGFDKKFADIESKVTEYDTKKRGHQDIQAQFKKRLKVIKDQKSDRLKELGELSIDELNKEIKKLEIEADKIIKKRPTLFGEIKKKRADIKKLNKENSTINNEIEEIKAEILFIENKFFKSIYSDPKILLAHHKFKMYGICMFCNQKITKEKKRNVVKKIESRMCPVCGSHLKLDLGVEVQEEKTRIIKDIVKKRKKVSELYNKLKSETEHLQRLKRELNKLENSYFSEGEELTDKLAETDDLKLRLSDLKESKIQETATYDRDIKTLNQQIEFYQHIIDRANEKYKNSLKKLRELNKIYESSIKELRKKLIKKFQSYAGNLFVNCELEIHKERTSESKISLPIFLPKIENVLRNSLDQVSKSEAIFLEYAFRMSLCHLYNSITKNQINFIVETSEGVFDIETVEMLADSLSKFSNKDYYLLLVSNLGRKDFLEYLKKKTDIDKESILNFFDIGKLRGAQKNKLAEYKEFVDEIISNQ
ncbi:MAG: hypothetical protein ACOC5T_00620 [Elusimicrobiota bacterium]